jgi:hypothetical protein
MTRENGATQIFPRTQKPWVHVTEATPEYFCADIGEAVVMDQRCYHRGKANFGTEDRPVLYFIYMRKEDKGLNADGTPVDENYQREDWPSVFDEPPSEEESGDEESGDEESIEEESGDEESIDEASSDEAEPTPARKRKNGTLDAETAEKTALDSDLKDNFTRGKRTRQLLDDSD